MKQMSDVCARCERLRARESPGVVCMKKHCQADKGEIRHMRSSTNSAAVAASGLPTTLPSGGISDTRLLYLNKEIKQYLGQDSEAPWSNATGQEEAEGMAEDL